MKDQAEVQTLNIRNYLNEAKVRILKETANYDGSKPKPTQNVEIQISEKGSNEWFTQMTDENGTVTFTLPVYSTDDNGTITTEKIIYEITEKLTDPTKYQYSDDLAAVLTIGETTTTGTNADGNGEGNVLLRIENRPYTGFTVKKEYYKIWENSFTQKRYPLEGALIGLYRKDGDKYILEETDLTDSVGQVSFVNLKDEEEYIAVELALPTDAEGNVLAEYQYLEPEEKNGENKIIPGHEIKEIPVEEIGNYNYAEKAKGPNDAKTLTNVEHWTQIRVLKHDIDTQEPVNHSVFKLYKQVVPEGVSDLSFDETQCDEIGTYTSGTLLNENGEAQDGWFATDILNVADNIVYWLVEEKPAPGYEFVPGYSPILFKRSTASYKNVTKITNAEGVEAQTVDYLEDQINDDGYKIPNKHLSGGDADHSARIKLSKWAGGVTKEQDNGTYNPLGNARYEIWIADANGNLLEQVDTVTTGLESNVNGEGTLTSQAMSTTFWYGEWCKKYPELFGEGTEGDGNVWEKTADGDIRVRMAIREVSAPAGYNLDAQAYYLWMTFEDALNSKHSTDVINEAYYVNSETGAERLSEDLPNYSSSTIYWAGENNTEEHIRLINRPVDNFAVTISNYGYTPNGNTFNDTADLLDSYFTQNYSERYVLPGVTMTLERWDEKLKEWRFYDYQNLRYYDEEVTGSLPYEPQMELESQLSGSFSFPHGLEMGTYRVIQTSYTGEEYELLYDSKANAREFTVSDSNLNVSMYNPLKVDLEIHKTGLATGNAKGVQFTLQAIGGSGKTYKDSTDEAGKASFSNIESGTYYLKEEDTNSPKKYWTEYFEEYIEAKYSELSEITNSQMVVYLGNREGKDASGEPIITDRITWGDNMSNELQVENPEYGTIQVQKKDDANNAVPKAQFTLYRKDITSTDGKNGTVAWSKYSSSDTSWTKVEPVAQTNESGSAGWTGLTPGLYYVTETDVPDGYQAGEDTDAYILLTGGMNVEVTGGNAQDYITKTTECTTTFINNRLGKIILNKNVNNPLQAEEAENYIFRLYDASGVQVGNDISVAEGVASTIENLTLGADYYLEEVIPKDAIYSLTEVKVDNAVTNPETGEESKNQGRYKIHIPETAGVEVTVSATNTYLSAKVTIFKADSKNLQYGLEGAVFGIYLGDTRISSLTELGDGYYTATVTLPSKEGATYTIKEEQAPGGYLDLEDDTGSGNIHAIEVELLPGDDKRYDAEDKELKELLLTNERGAVITLTKYDNVWAKENPGVLAGATFTLYVKENGNWVPFRSETTNAEGQISFTVAGNNEYALAETGVPAGYSQIGLESFWKDNSKLTERKLR